MLATTALVVGGAVFGCLNPGEGSRISTAFVYAIGGFMVAAYLRVMVFHVLLPVWRRVTFTTQAGWMTLQVGFTLLGAWAGVTGETPADMSRAGFICGLP